MAKGWTSVAIRTKMMELIRQRIDEGSIEDVSPARYVERLVLNDFDKLRTDQDLGGEQE